MLGTGVNTGTQLASGTVFFLTTSPSVLQPDPGKCEWDLCQGLIPKGANGVESVFGAPNKVSEDRLGPEQSALLFAWPFIPSSELHQPHTPSLGLNLH